ncbi:MAG: hypothetical protein R2741_15460 [Methanolobus sp.]
MDELPVKRKDAVPMGAKKEERKSKCYKIVHIFYSALIENPYVFI